MHRIHHGGLRLPIIVLTSVLVAFAGNAALHAAPQSGAILPDLLTVVPGHLTIRNQPGSSRLLFNNTIVNLGAGPLQVRGVSSGTITTAFQELVNSAGQIVASFPVSTYVFHPTHDHWHIDAVARYTLRAGTLYGAVVSEATKVTFCLIDTEAFLPKHQAGRRQYVDCNAALQGITNGWADEYVRSLPDQEVSVTGVPPGIYYLVSMADPVNQFVETNDNNNSAWVKIGIYAAEGGPRVRVLETSPCSGDLCGEK